MNFLKDPRTGALIHGFVQFLLLTSVPVIDLIQNGNPLDLDKNGLFIVMVISIVVQAGLSAYRHAGQTVTTAGDIHAQVNAGTVAPEAPVIAPK